MKRWVAEAWREMDFRMAEVRRSEALSCREGCAACCAGPIMLHPDEADVLVTNLTDAQLTKALGQQQRAFAAQLRLERIESGEVTHGLNQAGLLRLEASYAGRVCPVLDTETFRCTAYAVRPLVCRGMVSTAPPEMCEDSIPDIPDGSFEAREATIGRQPGGLEAAVLIQDGIVEAARRAGREIPAPPRHVGNPDVASHYMNGKVYDV